MKFKQVWIKMKFSQRGQDTAENGCALPPQMYIEGQEYPVSEDLAKNLVAVKAADIIEKKMKAPAPENKDLGGAPDEKGKGKKKPKDE